MMISWFNLIDDDDDDDDGVFSLSDVLITVTANSSQYNISDKMAEAGFTTDKNRAFSSDIIIIIIIIIITIVNVIVMIITW